MIHQIDRHIEEIRAKLVKDVIELINIKSVQGPPLPGAPFGEEPKRLLDAVLDMGKRDGFYTTDYNVGVISLALKEGAPDVGIWLHGDVVPEGDGWNFEPYNAVEYKGYVIGRGADDNKGQLAAIYNLLIIFKKLGIELNYNPAIYVGSNEEFGMADVVGDKKNPYAKGFLNVAKPPRLSLVPDGGFPLGYGGKGALNLELRSRKPLKGIKLTAGKTETPGLAEAIIDGFDIPDGIPECKIERNEKNAVSSYSEPRHGAHPDPDGNMITKLCAALAGLGILGDGNERILEFFKRVSLDTAGKMLGIYTNSEIMGEVTVFSKKITDNEGYPSLSVNIRYPIGISFEEIVKNVTRVANEWEFDVQDVERGVDPYVLPTDTAIPKMLTRMANEIFKTDSPPFTMGGGTYAHRLPNAYVYGSGFTKAPEGFPEGRGGAHGTDECVSIERLINTMKAYARALIALNELTDEF